MDLILYITGLLIVSYLLYPLYLRMMGSGYRGDETTGAIPDAVSVVLLTRNGKATVGEKVQYLLDELDNFANAELIIIDDHSDDGTQQILERFLYIGRIRVINKKQQGGIPHSMNLAVEMAKYGFVIFCDQRQKLAPGSLKRLLMPLANRRIGAVSGCISCRDLANTRSIVRLHENMIKNSESCRGNLIGVYGPFYAIRRELYNPIPENIILDDLYLSLKILRTNHIVLVKDCLIIDDRFSDLYDYRRVKRYLKGFLQILTDRNLLKKLSKIQVLMLFWHKYVRLLIPFFLFFTYLIVALRLNNNPAYLIIFSGMSIIGVAAVAQMLFRYKSGILDMVRINLYYLTATFDLMIGGVFFNLKLFVNRWTFNGMYRYSIKRAMKEITNEK